MKLGTANTVCPVCGYDRLEEPARDHCICECCGTQFGYHDATLSHAELRERWVTGGATWHSRRIPPPSGWDAWNQMKRAKLTVSKKPMKVHQG